MSDNKEFQWDEATAIEFAVFYDSYAQIKYVNDISDYIEQFKASKQPKKDYEILSCWDGESENTVHDYIPVDNKRRREPCLGDLMNCKIKSVRRLSDGLVVTVGGDVEQGKVSKITYDKEAGLHIHVNTGKLDYDYPYKISEISEIQKVKPTPLFTTEDGVEIFEGYEGDLWRIFTLPSSYEQWKPYNLGMPLYKNLGEKYFYTEHEANEYAVMNKPCLSLEDCYKIIRSISDRSLGLDTKSYLRNEFGSLVQSKLSNK